MNFLCAATIGIAIFSILTANSSEEKNTDEESARIVSAVTSHVILAPPYMFLFGSALMFLQYSSRFTYIQQAGVLIAIILVFFIGRKYTVKSVKQLNKKSQEENNK